MRIPKVSVVRNDNQRNRLTVTPNRITLKLKNDVTEEEEKHLVNFSIMIAQRTLHIFLRAMRGCFAKDLQSIEMANTSRSLHCLYCFDELEPEGFSDNPVQSDKAESKTTTTYWSEVGRSGGQQMWLYEDW